MKPKLAVLLTVGCLVLAACQPIKTPTSSPAAVTPSVAPTPTVTTPSPPTVRSVTKTPPEADNEITDRVVVDLADRLQVDTEDITVAATFSDEFSAQDLGCPQGRNNTPVQPAFVTGTVIQLRVGDTLYEYHAHGGRFVYCGQR